MTVKISRDSFIALLDKSGLIVPETLKQLSEEFFASQPGGDDESERLAQFLIRRGELTTWQAKKLLQGKHKGFTLGKYRLLSLLGRGGMSSVYLAEHRLMRRRCAIKVLPSKQVNNAAALDRFHQEAQAAAALDDPNIVRAYDVDHVTEGNTEIHFLVMEYVEGRSLQELVDQDGPLAIPDAVDYVCQAASGLHHAHEAGMVHRDIKPSNLLLDVGGTVKVLDMGLARFFEQTDQQSLTLEHDQRVLGTADYLSPEQAVDSHRVDTRSDIYSLGGTLYFLLTGHPPFPEGTLAQRLLAHQTKQPRPVSEVRPDVPASFARIVDQMMAKSPADRPASAGEVRNLLQDWMAAHGDSFTGAGKPPQIARTARAGKPPDPTSDGWRELPRESFTPPPTSQRTHATSVAEDPGLGEFLTSLSDQVERDRGDSDQITSAKTVVSRTSPAKMSRSKPRTAPADAAEAASVIADSAVHARSGGSAARSGSRIQRRASKLPAAIVGVSSAMGVLLIGGYFLWPSADNATPETAATSGTRDAAATDPVEGDSGPPTRPPVEPGGDITVGPEGNFATIGEAVAFVRKTFQPFSEKDERTIRVAGGITYPEALEIDNSQYGAFPKWVRIVCEDASPAVLAPPGTAPVIDLINVERFQLQGFELSGRDRPVAMRVAGYLVDSTFENLTLRDVNSTAIEAIGISGTPGSRVEFRNIVVHASAPGAVGISLDAGDRTTNELLIDRCRFGGPMSVGIRFQSEATSVTIAQCRFDRVDTPILFSQSGQPLESIAISNNTFRRFDRGIQFAGVPEFGRKAIGFQKNLFADGLGPEVVVEGQPESWDASSLWKGAGARFNWSDGSGDVPAGSVDIFRQDGRRGVEAIEFASDDVTDADSFLRPAENELRSAAANAPNPKYIGAVPPRK